MFNQRERDLLEAALRTFEAHREQQGTDSHCPACSTGYGDADLENHIQNQRDRVHETAEIINLREKIAHHTNLYAK